MILNTGLVQLIILVYTVNNTGIVLYYNNNYDTEYWYIVNNTVAGLQLLVYSCWWFIIRFTTMIFNTINQVAGL